MQKLRGDFSSLGSLTFLCGGHSVNGSFDKYSVAFSSDLPNEPSNNARSQKSMPQSILWVVMAYVSWPKASIGCFPGSWNSPNRIQFVEEPIASNMRSRWNLPPNEDLVDESVQVTMGAMDSGWTSSFIAEKPSIFHRRILSSSAALEMIKSLKNLMLEASQLSHFRVRICKLTNQHNLNELPH